MGQRRTEIGVVQIDKGRYDDIETVCLEEDE
jgi:hypothetical protein